MLKKAIKDEISVPPNPLMSHSFALTGFEFRANKMDALFIGYIDKREGKHWILVFSRKEI